MATDYQVSQERFLEVTDSSSSAGQAAERLGMPKAIYLARASYYRSKGVAVKSFASSRPGSRDRSYRKSKANRILAFAFKSPEADENVIRGTMRGIISALASTRKNRLGY